MLRTALVWLSLTALVAILLGLIAWRCGPAEAKTWMLAGVGVSLVTSLVGSASVRLSGLADQPFPRLLLETSIRMALPLGVLLAVSMTRREILTPTFVLYFLPFQFITLIADTAGALWRVNSKA
ncbi:MAG: hypothetical protein ACR2NU_08750 [Aeoliella sp.]